LGEDETEKKTPKKNEWRLRGRVKKTAKLKEENSLCGGRRDPFYLETNQRRERPESRSDSRKCGLIRGRKKTRGRTVPLHTSKNSSDNRPKRAAKKKAETGKDSEKQQRKPNGRTDPKSSRNVVEVCRFRGARNQA